MRMLLIIPAACLPALYNPSILVQYRKECRVEWKEILSIETVRSPMAQALNPENFLDTRSPMPQTKTRKPHKP